jgi:hypothetical protein
MVDCRTPALREPIVGHVEEPEALGVFGRGAHVQLKMKFRVELLENVWRCLPFKIAGRMDVTFRYGVADKPFDGKLTSKFSRETAADRRPFDILRISSQYPRQFEGEDERERNDDSAVHDFVRHGVGCA